MKSKEFIQPRSGLERVLVTQQELLQLSINGRMISLAALRRTNSQSGQHFSRLLSRGMEFAESRRYQTGDDIRNIDWRVTARTGKTHTKLFAAEKERRVFVVADMRSSMFFATRGVFKSVQAALMMGLISWSATLAGDKLGGLVFDEESIFESRPALGKRGIFPFLHALAEKGNFLEKKKKENKGTKELSPDQIMDKAIGALHRLATPGSLIFLVSDFRHLTPYAQNLLIQLSFHSDLCLCFVYDPLEKEFPKKGDYLVTDGKSESLLNMHSKGAFEKYRQKFNERREQLLSLSAYRHIHLLEWSTEEDCFEVLMKNFNKRVVK